MTSKIQSGGVYASMSSIDSIVKQLNEVLAANRGESTFVPTGQQSDNEDEKRRDSATLKEWLSTANVVRPESATGADGGAAPGARRPELEQFVGASFGNTTFAMPGAGGLSSSNAHGSHGHASSHGGAHGGHGHTSSHSGSSGTHGHTPTSSSSHGHASSSAHGGSGSGDAVWCTCGGELPASKLAELVAAAKANMAQPVEAAPPAPPPAPIPQGEMNTPTAGTDTFRWKKHVTTVENALRKKEIPVAEALLTLLTELADILPVELTVRLRLMTQLANIKVERGQIAEAQVDLVKALKSVEGTESKKSLATAFCLDALAQCYQSEEKFEQSEKARRTAVIIAEDCLGAEHPDASYFRERLELARQVRAIAMIGSDEDSKTILDKLTDQYNALVAAGQTPEPPEAKVADSTAGYMFEKYLANGKNALAKKNALEAESALRSAVDKGQGLPDSDPRKCEGLRLLAAVVDAQGKQQEAKQLYETALTMAFKSIGWSDIEVAHSLAALAELHNKLGDVGIAKNYYKQAVATYALKLGKDDETTKTLQASYDAFIERIKEERKWTGWSQ